MNSKNIVEEISLKLKDSPDIPINFITEKEFTRFIEAIPEKYFSEVIEFIRDVKNENQKKIFKDVLLNNYKRYKSKGTVNFISQIRNLRKGFFIQNITISKTYEKTCNNTYKGFYRALKAGTLQTTKVMIDGKLTRVFIKNSTGNYGNISGTNKLFIDPNNLNVYAFKSDKYGKIKSIEKKIDFKNPSFKISQEVKQFGIAFKKELIDTIKEKYFNNRKPITFKKEIKIPKSKLKRK